MMRISDVVQQAMASGYLSVRAENQLRRLLKSKYDLEDLKAFFKLQRATMEGLVKQESREFKGLT
ncbi:hypothetical protein H6F61_21095 [Cyanobacteria bacterium FACHB-472]|nr:hypothetical protein [Cyanobacteria bacterium FACHB-472]